jgi:hypothetical protein
MADGMGIHPLLMSVLYLYLSERYGTDGIDAAPIQMPSHPVLPQEYAYPFPEEPLLMQRRQKGVDAAYSLDQAAFDRQGLYAYHLHLPQRAVMQVASPADGSPVSFLSVMLFRALCALDEGIELPVVAQVQHQYRAAVQTPLSRPSLVAYIPVSLPPKLKERSVELQNTAVRGQILLGSEPEQALRSVNGFVSVLSQNEGRSLAEKQLAMQRYIEGTTRPKTFGISFMGQTHWYGMEKYIEDLHVYIGEKDAPPALWIEVMTLGEVFSVNFMQSGRGTRYLDAFIGQLQSFDIPVRLIGQERYTLCDTELAL